MALSDSNSVVLLADARREFGITGIVKMGDFLASRSSIAEGATGSLPRTGRIVTRNFRGVSRVDLYSPKLWLRMEELSGIVHGGTISSWKGATGSGSPNATAYAAGTGTLPIVQRSREPFPFVRFGTGAASLTNGNYLDFGAQTFNISTTGGFTAIFMVRFCRDVGNYERVFDFGISNILFCRTTTTTGYTSGYRNGASVFDVASIGSCTGNWQIISQRIRPSEHAYFDGTKVVDTTRSFVLENKSPTFTYIAKSHTSSDAYANMDLMEFLCYDKALSDSEIGLVRDYLQNKYPVVPITSSITWPTLLSITRPTGTFAVSSTGTSPDIQWQLNSSSVTNTINNAWRSLPLLHTSSGFVCNFELHVSGYADVLYFFMGNSNVNSFEDGTAVNGGYSVTFNIFSQSTVYGGIKTLLYHNGTQLASGSFAGNATWQPVEIVYTNSTSNTWRINWNGNNVISYNDPNVNTRIIPGNLFGIGSRTGGGAGDFYIRRVNTYFTGYNNTLPPVQNGLIGYYTGESFSNNTWFDMSGSNNNATCTNTVNNAVTINGYKACSGGMAGTVTWPVGILPTTYTLFHVTKYNGPNKFRIISSSVTSSNWLSGHHGSKAGVAYHGGTAWVTQEANNFALDSWILSADQTTLYRGNRQNLTINVTGVNCPLAINKFTSAELSDWACASVIVYNRALSTPEIETVENWLVRKYAIASLPIPNWVSGYGSPAGITGTGAGVYMPFLSYGSIGAMNTTFRLATAFGSTISEGSSLTYTLQNGGYQATQLAIGFNSNYSGEVVLQRSNANGIYVNTTRKKVRNVSNVFFDITETGDTSASINALVPYPPGPLWDGVGIPPSSGSNVTISGYSYGNGVYTASASTEYSIGNSNEYAIKAFNRNITGWDGWTTSNQSYTTASYNGTILTYLSGRMVAGGEWLQISLPTSIILKAYRIYPLSANRNPKYFKILGANQYGPWIIIDTRTNETGWVINNTNPDTNGFRTFLLPQNTTSYQYYRLTVDLTENASGSNYLSIQEWILYAENGYNSQFTDMTSLYDGNNAFRSSGNTWLPSMLGTFNAFLSNSPTYLTPYYILNGTNQCLAIPSQDNVNNFTNTQTYSVGFWVYINSNQPNIGSPTALLEKSTGSPRYPYVFRYDYVAPNRRIITAAYDGSSVPVAIYNMPDWKHVNNWNFVVGTFDHGNRKVKLHINGVFCSSNTSTYTLNNCGNTDNVILGQRDGGGNFWLQGRIGYFATWNRVLTDSEITNLYNTTFAIPRSLPTGIVGDGLILYLDPTDPMCYPGSGAVLNNLVPQSLHITGTLTGTYSYSGGRVRLTNTSTNSTLNVSTLQIMSLPNIRTISVWYYVHSSAAGVNSFFLDARDGLTEGYIWKGAIGSGISSAALYINGGNSQSLTWAALDVVGSLRHATIITTASFTDDITMFGRLSTIEGMDVSFGPIMIYDRALTQSEIIKNYNMFASKFFLLSFTNVGTITWTAPVTALIRVLVVGAGGGGGSGLNRRSGGGGAGGVNYNSSFAITSGTTYTVVIGTGGVGGTANKGGNGGNSSFGSLIGYGGGGGAGNGVSAATGGSGGGGGDHDFAPAGASATQPSSGIPGTNYGSGGANGTYDINLYKGGGGGGASSAGNSTTGGNGVSIDITGTSVVYGAGGGAGTQGVGYSSGGGLGGTGGGGNGAGGRENGVAVAGSDATFYGGGGGGGSTGGNGGLGYQGIVIISYP